MNSTMIQQRDKRRQEIVAAVTGQATDKGRRGGCQDLKKGYESIENKGIEGNKGGEKKVDKGGWKRGIEC